MFRASSCPSSGEWYKTDNAYGIQHWPCCSRLEEKRWFGVHLLGLVSGPARPGFTIQDARSREIAIISKVYRREYP
jgi:hypothetical protein